MILNMHKRANNVRSTDDQVQRVKMNILSFGEVYAGFNELCEMYV